MDSERETRFTGEVIVVATERVDASRDRLADQFATSTGAGEALLREFGWGDLATWEAIDDMTQAYVTATRHLEESERLEAAVSAAFLNGLLIGGVAADVTYERCMGIVA